MFILVITFIIIVIFDSYIYYKSSSFNYNHMSHSKDKYHSKVKRSLALLQMDS